MFQIKFFTFASGIHTLLLAVTLTLCNPRQIDNVTAADHWNTLGGGSRCPCRSSVTTPRPLRLSRVDEVIAQLLRISAVPDGWLLRVCVHVCVHIARLVTQYWWNQATSDSGLRCPGNCPSDASIPDSGMCSAGAGRQRSLTKTSSSSIKSQNKETHTNYKRWY